MEGTSGMNPGSNTMPEESTTKLTSGDSNQPAAPKAAPEESPSLNVSWLLVLARQAYEQKRAKNCLALTKAILLIDPTNQEALAIQASAQSGFATTATLSSSTMAPESLPRMESHTQDSSSSLMESESVVVMR